MTILLLLLVLGLALLPLLPSLRELRARRDAQAIAVDALALHDTRYFANSFRTLIGREVRDLFAPARSSAQVLHGEMENGESYVLVPGTQPYQPHHDEEDDWAVSRILLSASELSLPDALELQRECYASGSLRVGRDCLLRAAYSEGDVELMAGATIQRWVHAEGDLLVGEDCALHGRASAEDSILFTASGGFERLRAPLIEIGRRELHDSWRRPRADLHNLDLRRQNGKVEIQAGRATVHGDLAVPEHCVLKGDLVVRGDLRVGKDSHLQGNVKVHGDIRLEAGVAVMGALIGLQDAKLESGCRVRGPLLIEHHLRVDRRCQLGDAVALTTVRARQIEIAEGSRVHGTLWATERGWVQQ